MRRNSDMGFFELEKAKKWVDKLGLEWAMKAIKHHESHLGMTSSYYVISYYVIVERYLRPLST